MSHQSLLSPSEESPASKLSASLLSQLSVSLTSTSCALQSSGGELRDASQSGVVSLGVPQSSWDGAPRSSLSAAPRIAPDKDPPTSVPATALPVASPIAALVAKSPSSSLYTDSGWMGARRTTWVALTLAAWGALAFNALARSVLRCVAVAGRVC